MATSARCLIETVRQTVDWKCGNGPARVTVAMLFPSAIILDLFPSAPSQEVHPVCPQLRQLEGDGRIAVRWRCRGVGEAGGAGGGHQREQQSCRARARCDRGRDHGRVGRVVAGRRREDHDITRPLIDTIEQDDAENTHYPTLAGVSTAAICSTTDHICLKPRQRVPEDFDGVTARIDQRRMAAI
jgi:hypothetical protein